MNFDAYGNLKEFRVLFALRIHANVILFEMGFRVDLKGFWTYWLVNVLTMYYSDLTACQIVLDRS